MLYQIFTTNKMSSCNITGTKKCTILYSSTIYTDTWSCDCFIRDIQDRF